MITIKNVKSIVRRTAMTTNNEAVSSVVSGRYNIVPDYSIQKSAPKICLQNLEICKVFYRKFSESLESEMICPFGFRVAKYSRALSVKDENISIYSIIENTELYDSSTRKERSKIHRSKVKDFDDAVESVLSYKINNQIAIDEHNNIVEVFETLMVGRIGMSVQGLTHQILTPIQAAIADIENVGDYIDSGGSEYIYRLRHNVDQITSISHQLQVIISSDMEYNDNMLRKVTVHNVIERSIENTSLAAKNKYVEVQQGFNNYGKTVECVPYHIDILFDNLVENSVKYSFSGFIDFDRKVYINYREEGNQLVIEIENQGCEITQEEIREGLIFELGYRGVGAQDRERDGTGTGLYVCKKIVDLYKGDIIVQSSPIDKDSEVNRRFRNKFSVKIPYYQK